MEEGLGVELRVSTEVEPGVFDEAGLQEVGARVLRHVQPGWISVGIDANRVEDLHRVPGVLDTMTVVACEDRLDQLPAGAAWEPLGQGECGDLALTLEAARQDGAVVALRLTAEAREILFIRSHQTDAVDIALSRPDRSAPEGRRVVVAHSDGLRDWSGAGMHNWKAGERHQIVMWVGHLPAGDYHVRAGVLEGWVRVKGRPTPCVLEAEASGVGR